jgi:hypothetical protein
MISSFFAARIMGTFCITERKEQWPSMNVFPGEINVQRSFVVLLLEFQSANGGQNAP